MTETPHTITCPNCGAQATGNYCSECGQATHLHKENFGHMIMHFFEHYFHYDSKFLRTMNALWFKPGELTLAYWRGQRMKYIPPISLYIFISAVYFLVSSLVLPTQLKQIEQRLKDLQKQHIIRAAKNDTHRTDTVVTNGHTTITETKKIDPIAHPEMMEMIAEKAQHHLPKLMFFMIPYMGLILQLLFLKRKETFFVDHVVFSLHWHAFYFSTLLITLIPIGIWAIVISLLVGFLRFYYTVIAMKNTYKIDLMVAIGYSLILTLAYAIILGLAAALYIRWLTQEMLAGMS